ncbi:MAG TPA: hypothetical protein PK109_02190 [Candidatus Paceibacterota bacterium]|nr:hypothetical protein [Candidatus Paceibacterota bacterium]
MEPTLLLARVFGVYFIIAAVMVFMNRKALMISVEAMFKERFAQMIAAMLSILGGLLFINLYQDWSTLASGIISAIAWLILLKGLLYAFVPEARLVKLFKGFTEGNWYTMDGILALVLGIYLSGIGYGMW